MQNLIDKVIQKFNVKKEMLLSSAEADQDNAWIDTEINPASHKILWIALVFFMIAIIWAYFAIIDEVTAAQGTVIPSKQIQLIQNLEGGIVNEILVKKGQMVEKGEVLAYLDKTRSESEYNASRKKEVSLRIRIMRLMAETNGQPFIVPPDLQNVDPGLTASETSLYQTRMHQLEVLQSQRALSAKEITLTQPLVKGGDVSKVELLHLQQSLDDIDSKILLQKSTELDELNKVKGDLAALQQDQLALQDRLTRTTVRSPVKGIVNEIYINTVGGVIKPGENLLDIVPLDDTLLVEAKVRPADIGFIHPGQDATVKITAYDFSIYGGLKGNVEHISADAIKDEDKKGESYYEIWVRTKQNYILYRGKSLYIIPGMTATVDILTGHKSVMDYILKPILKAKQSALRER